MTGGGAPAHRAGSGRQRIGRAWRVLPAERRLATFAAIGLFVTLFLPWYQETVIVPGGGKPTAVSATVTGWGAFSFVEAAVLLVALSVLTLLFQRAEGHAFHLPGGDGGAITAAGSWTCLLVLWRIFDKQSTVVRGPGATISGIEWGILVALAVAGSLAYAGTRIRAAHQPEPPLPGERPRRRQSPPPGRPPAGEPAAGGTVILGEPAGGEPSFAAEELQWPEGSGPGRADGRRPRPPRPVFADELPTIWTPSASGDERRGADRAPDRAPDRPADPEVDPSEAVTRVRRPLAPEEPLSSPFDRDDVRDGRISGG